MLGPRSPLEVEAMRVVDEDAAHGLRRCRDEMGAVPPVHAFGIDQPQVGFVDQGRGLQAVAGAFAPHVVVRQDDGALVDDRRQQGERTLIPVAPRPQSELTSPRTGSRGVSVQIHRAAGIIWAFSLSSRDSSFGVLRLSE